MHLNNGHRVCLILAILGLLLLTAAYVAPFWVRISAPFVQRNVGPVFTCSEETLQDRKCAINEFNRNFDWFEIFRWLAGSGAASGLLLTLGLCCTLCYNSDSTLLCQGIAVFIAGGLGVAGAGIFAARYPELNSSSFWTAIAGAPPQLDWAFYAFIVDASFLVILSVVFCTLPRITRLDVHPV